MQATRSSDNSGKYAYSAVAFTTGRQSESSWVDEMRQSSSEQFYFQDEETPPQKAHHSGNTAAQRQLWDLMDLGSISEKLSDDGQQTTNSFQARYFRLKSNHPTAHSKGRQRGFTVSSLCITVSLGLHSCKFIWQISLLFIGSLKEFTLPVRALNPTLPCISSAFKVQEEPQSPTILFNLQSQYYINLQRRLLHFLCREAHKSFSSDHVDAHYRATFAPWCDPA